jgi:hypothetical protein
MKQENDFYNLYVEYENSKSSEDELFNSFVYLALKKDEITHYIDLLKRKLWGEQTVGDHLLQVVPAHTIKIFDLSKVLEWKGLYSREQILKIISLKPEAEIPLIEQLEEYGKDVTKEMFGEELEVLLNRLQLEIQIDQRGINAETGDLGSFFSEENMKGQVKSGSSVEAKLKGKGSPFFPKEFVEGILDSAVYPAFKVEKIASVFANHLKNLKHENGQMIGVFGKWGRGKSYFVRQVFLQLGVHPKDEKKKTNLLKKVWSTLKCLWDKILKPKETFVKIFKKNQDKDELPFCVIKFQAWKYQSTPSIWAYLFETFVKDYLDVNWWDRIWRTFHLSIIRIGNWRTWGKPLIVVIIGVLWFLLIPFLLKFLPFLTSGKLSGTFEEVSTAIKWLGGVGAISFVVARINSFIKFSKKPALSLFNSLSKVPSFKHVLGIQEEIHKEFVFLIKSWNKYLDGKRLLLFIDDLDRCSHHSLIEIVDSLRVMLDDEEINRHVLVLMALDEDKLQRVVYTKYDNLFKENVELETIAIEYLDKLFISAIKLYPISDDERAEYIKKIATQINSEKFETSVEKGPENEEKTNNAADAFGEKEDSQSTVEKEKVVFERSVDKESQEEVETFQNLNESEVNTLAEKIKKTDKELTPRQIRIVVYRYLLARNLWLAMAKELEFKTDGVLGEILRLSGYSKEDRTAATKINPLLFNIVRMVVAY